MKGWIGLVSLALGIVLSASFAARNGDRHTRHRQAVAEVAAARAAVGVIEQGKKLNEQLASEGTDLSALGIQEAMDLMKSEPRLRAQIEAHEAAMADLRAWNLGAGSPAELLHVAERRRDAIGLPPPRERFAQWASVGGAGFSAGLVLIVLGAVLARRQAADESAGVAGPAAGRADFAGSVRQALDVLARVEAEIAGLEMDRDAPAARDALDRLVDECLTPLADARGQLIQRHGLGTFAEYFGPFSAGERNVNRAWSALTDGHAVVARESIQSAKASFEAAAAAWTAVEARSTGAR